MFVTTFREQELGPLTRASNRPRDGGLRRVDRYGIPISAQYHGFRLGRALPEKVLTSREAAALIAENGDDPENYLQDPEAVQ